MTSSAGARLGSAVAPIRVLLVDDEDIVRYGLKSICQAETALEVVGEANNGRDAIAQAKALIPDVVLMDINMPILDGISATESICQALPSTKVLILTAFEDDDHLVDAMQKGALGYVLKNTPPEDFVCIIRAAHKGYMQIGPSLSRRLCQQLKPLAAVKQPTTCEGITPREREVLSLVAEGASNREIANRLYIAEKTVKNHVSSLLSRVGVRDRTQLALWERQAGTRPATERQLGEKQLSKRPLVA
ncbi:MAG: response regulator transcription factor [Cyanobacteria bacterium J06626_6]